MINVQNILVLVISKGTITDGKEIVGQERSLEGNLLELRN